MIKIPPIFILLNKLSHPTVTVSQSDHLMRTLLQIHNWMANSSFFRGHLT